MFISVTFPLADFRGLHRDKCGRLDRPSWGSADPRATFARGFGAIHTRNKSGNGFSGENYYADCGSLVKYPNLIFINATPLFDRRFLVYPVYKRFFFDGQFSGRFEFGFRVNEATIQEMRLMHPSEKYDPVGITSQLLENKVIISLLDKQIIASLFYKSSLYLRDGYIMSSTFQKSLAVYDVASVGSAYVDVGAPFIFIRSSTATPVGRVKRKRELLSGDGFSMYQTRSRIKEREFDTVVLESTQNLMSESPKERLSRLFYSQIRTITFAHSYYLTKIDEGKLPKSDHLAPAIGSMIQKIKELMPVSDDSRDIDTCKELRAILDKSDINVELLSSEIERRLKPKWISKILSGVFTYVDKKADIAIGAAASTATKQILTSSP